MPGRGCPPGHFSFLAALRGRVSLQLGRGAVHRPGVSPSRWILVPRQDAGRSARGSWLFQLPFSAEAHDGALLYPYYLLLGHLSPLLGLPLPLILHLARVAGGLILVAVSWAFFGWALEGRGARWAAFLLFTFGSGFGWLAALFGHLSADLLIPESNAFHSVFVNAHFGLSTALLLLVVMAMGRAVVEDRLRFAWLAGAAALPMVLLQPFLAVTVYAVVGTWIAARLTHRATPHGFSALGALAYLA